ncbi:unnamed protein product, partial [Mesorhabditis belari]|uniref:Uncharacterized protein n=1 Tax=Mesorhabditis belari TaxID=2138241 RepID=A0AAF3FNF4_9BILA
MGVVCSSQKEKPDDEQIEELASTLKQPLTSDRDLNSKSFESSYEQASMFNQKRKVLSFRVIAGATHCKHLMKELQRTTHEKQMLGERLTELHKNHKELFKCNTR